MKSRYQQAKTIHEYSSLRRKTKVIGTWDDHDYGLNDAGKEFEGKITNQRLLLDFLDEPLGSTRSYQTIQLQLALYSIRESWRRFPREKSHLFELISDSKREGVFFISGDVQFGEIARYNCAAGYPLYDITLSGLTQAVEKAVSPPLCFIARILAWLTQAILRVKDKSCRYRSCTYGQPNFGTIEINWDSDPVDLKFHVRDEKGLPVSALKISLYELQGQKMDSEMTIGLGKFQKYCSLEVDLPWFVRYRLAIFFFSALAVLLLATIGFLCAVRSCCRRWHCKYKHG